MPRMTGTQVMEGLILAADQFGFMAHHETDSRRTNPGFPDLLIVGYRTQFVIECKSIGERFIEPRIVVRRNVRVELPGQVEWLRQFAETGTSVVYVCRDYGLDHRPVNSPHSPGQSDGHLIREVGYEYVLGHLRDVRERTLD